MQTEESEILLFTIIKLKSKSAFQTFLHRGFTSDDIVHNEWFLNELFKSAWAATDASALCLIFSPLSTIAINCHFIS